jgi:hypothetical protein
MASSSDVPGYDRTQASRGSPDRSGEGAGGDVTVQPGQYPPGETHGIFGGPLPTGTGAPGSSGGSGGDGDPTNQAGQDVDAFAGVSGGDLTSTGAPGSAGATGSTGGGGDSVDFTRPGSYLSGTYAQDTVRGNIDGPQDWTQANDSGYGTGGPKLPGMHEPQAGSGEFQPGRGGRVLRGGRPARGG